MNFSKITLGTSVFCAAAYASETVKNVAYNALDSARICTIAFGYVFSFPIAALSGTLAIGAIISQDMREERNRALVKRSVGVFLLSTATHITTSMLMQAEDSLKIKPQRVETIHETAMTSFYLCTCMSVLLGVTSGFLRRLCRKKT